MNHIKETKWLVIAIHQKFYLALDWFKCVTWLHITSLKLENVLVKNSNFQNRRKNTLGYLSLNSIRSLKLTIFLSENCSLLGNYNVRGQMTEHIFAPKAGYCLYNNNVFRADETISLKICSPRDILLAGWLYYTSFFSLLCLVELFLSFSLSDMSDN